MKRKMFFILFIPVVITLIFAGYGITAQAQPEVKGTVMKIEAIEYEITLKDNKSKETKVKVKDTGSVKVGDSIIVKDGKAKKAVKPISGGY